VSTIYLLPPRPLLGQQLLQSCLPGLELGAADRAALAETVAAAAEAQPDVCVIFREDLPDDGPLGQTLVDDFGAHPGDEVVEVAARDVRRWQIGR
jgi:hypothetical protein